MGVAYTGDRHMRRKILERGSLKCAFLPDLLLLLTVL